jgi:hypothetical protein
MNASSAVAPFWSKLEVLGQAGMTYILAQSDRAFYMIDQHAAHERLVYERMKAQGLIKLKGRYKGKKGQNDKQRYVDTVKVQKGSCADCGCWLANSACSWTSQACSAGVSEGSSVNMRQMLSQPFLFWRKWLYSIG